MKEICWNPEKDEQLKQQRGISFRLVVIALAEGGLLDDLVHPNKERYSNQRLFVVRIGDYAYLVPYVETENQLFLKTVIPSRKATKQYIG